MASCWLTADTEYSCIPRLPHQTRPAVRGRDSEHDQLQSLNHAGELGDRLSAMARGKMLERKARRVAWREGTNTTLHSRFARIRVMVTRDDVQPRDPEWLLVEWPDAETRPTKFVLNPDRPRRASRTRCCSRSRARPRSRARSRSPGIGMTSDNSSTCMKSKREAHSIVEPWRSCSVWPCRPAWCGRSLQRCFLAPIVRHAEVDRAISACPFGSDCRTRRMRRGAQLSAGRHPASRRGPCSS